MYNYFDYVLSQCRSQSIKLICEVVPTRRELIDKAAKEFNGCKNITADWRLIRAVQNCFDNSQIINHRSLDFDTRDVFDRCYHSICSKEKPSHEQLFEALVDFNWLMAAIHNSKINKCRMVKLQVNHHELIKSTKAFLLEIYNNAIDEYNECIYIDEALKAKGKIFTGLYPFQYEKSKKYAWSDYTYSDLKSMQHEFTENSISRMSLFYGLTATAALAENIRRFG